MILNSLKPVSDNSREEVHFANDHQDVKNPSL
ncbi:hypothetical protein LVISKB_P3-0028 (plasmid) [Levilactobacillus brevis KB290]|uniref:Uncharacterized protein n=1 Tax=Levilactobacillus brevis KB290 TaxID=1001583 RepID=M5AIA8_LEVBR|nr:hypothetical protein LVISKB_P3-0028 [Levilactobacillus brevis KB290]